MQRSWLSSSIVLAGLTTVSLAAASIQPIGEWTVYNASRSRSQDNTLCTWSFTVADTTPEANANSVFDCGFNVTAQPGDDCGLTSFQDSCSGNEAFTVGGGHSGLGFFVIVLENKAQNSQAFFGFSDGPLDSGSEIPEQTKPIYSQAAVKRDKLPMRRDGVSNGTASATEWKIQDLTRVINYQKHNLTIAFTILDGTPSGAHCLLHLDPPTGADLPTWEWYDRRCEDSGYYASWGYMPASDAGIVTIVNSTQNGQAFFGFPNINSTPFLGDAGPNPVSSCACG
ncbi:hypothetical protein F5Y13DRAFT_187491 [Hypoxylon sp. FL1857]|nr:hypothetical protein F5Y13DRAFT_187491 [Hypoxylon sp. FL1857]